jgi:hypothetical protein
VNYTHHCALFAALAASNLLGFDLERLRERARRARFGRRRQRRA